jgi:hypothetical protein
MGYAIGALTTGIIADFFSIGAAIGFIGLLTLVSAMIIGVRMSCRSFTPPQAGVSLC